MTGIYEQVVIQPRCKIHLSKVLNSICTKILKSFKERISIIDVTALVILLSHDQFATLKFFTECLITWMKAVIKPRGRL